MMLKSFYLFISVLLWRVNGDIYMQNPRGSNNRLNENTATRRNAKRVFNSQNNDRGGYNVGDRTDAAANNKDGQYQMSYFESSPNAQMGDKSQGATKLLIEWTAQHGCGGNEDNNPNELNCNIVLQYLCRPVGFSITDPNLDMIRDGTTTDTPDYQDPQSTDSYNDYLNRKKGKVRTDRVLQEPFEFYDKCAVRDRNKGLFTADQSLKCENARCTRQSPNGNNNQYGYECPEERDYYPYWHPTDWKDIAVLAQNASMCSYYTSESFNIKSKYECVEMFDEKNVKHYSKFNNQKDCEAAGKQWLEFNNYLEIDTESSENACSAKNNAQRNSGITYFWGRPMYGKDKKCLIKLKEPDCKEAQFSRANHLGNGADLNMLNYTWTLPYFPSNTPQQCVLRIRYNISTDDYDPYNTNSASNNDPNVLKQNPLVDVGIQNQPLQLAINTAQYGRTFEDRTHMFNLVNRPSSVANTVNIWNLNVRGKRGNIVQTYPAVEYDFVPTDLKVKTADYIHAQWTGSNTHNNNGGGDGQGGDAGEGTTGTDRNNMLSIGDRLTNYPLPFENMTTFCNNAELIWTYLYPTTDSLKNFNSMDCSVMFATSGKFMCVQTSTCSQSLEAGPNMDNLLNNAPASFQGALFKMTKTGTYNYMCSRNNNFSNRSQKGTLIVS
ncbi:protein DD3-3 isoform X2 [Hydra vulgaris]|uniref:Protein DD3-3 isoform X2 n=1 Tax=Hydra vulgaris TaxID=6087 RepID=A0ABM4DGR7_HYDVU